MREILNYKISRGTLLAGILLFAASQLATAGEMLQKVISLEGQWKYSIGSQDSWMEPGFDEGDWESIHVPSAWEDQGFHGYNGFGTYRKHFKISSNYKGKTLYLLLGYVDDVDETYINGQKIGSTGSFPPAYQSAYNAKRVYVIPEDVIRYDKDNVIVVKVYDSYQYGGICKGPVGIYFNPNEVNVQVNLQGSWKFKPGDDLDRKEVTFNDESWNEIFVPGKWEDQGYRDYDGYAWYRKTFRYEGSLNDEKAVLMLGKIDDTDEVYVNGIKIGATGDFTTELNKRIPTENRYQALRGYYFDTNILKKGKMNTIAVRVYDSGGGGGIYEGPVGLLTQEDYVSYWRQRKKMNSNN